MFLYRDRPRGCCMHVLLVVKMIYMWCYMVFKSIDTCGGTKMVPLFAKKISTDRSPDEDVFPR